MPKRSKHSSVTPQHTEMTFSSDLAEWINTIVKKENLPFGRAVL